MKGFHMALTSVAQLVGYPPAKQKVIGSLPGQGMSLDCGFSSQSGCVLKTTDRCISFTSMFLSLSFFLPPPAS